VLTHVAAGRGVFIPPRVPEDEFSSSTSSAMDIPWRIGIMEEKRGDDGERSSSERPPGVGRMAGSKIVLTGGRGRGHLCVAGVVDRKGNARSSESAGR
jgi:hypothetical protein